MRLSLAPDHDCFVPGYRDPMFGLPTLEEIALAKRESNEPLLLQLASRIHDVQKLGERLIQLGFIPLFVVVAGMIGVPLWAWVEIFAISALLLLPLSGFFLLNRAAWRARALKEWSKQKYPTSAESTLLNRKRDRVNAKFGEIQVYLGEGTRVKGVVNFAGAMRVDGNLEGEIVGEEVLIIGGPGQVKADIEVGTVVVSGQVEGNITAKQRVELLGPSRVTGTIRTPCLVVAEGALLNGNFSMTDAHEGKVVRLEPKQEGGLEATERA